MIDDRRPWVSRFPQNFRPSCRLPNYLGFRISLRFYPFTGKNCEFACAFPLSPSSESPTLVVTHHIISTFARFLLIPFYFLAFFVAEARVSVLRYHGQRFLFVTNHPLYHPHPFLPSGSLSPALVFVTAVPLGEHTFLVITIRKLRPSIFIRLPDSQWSGLHFPDLLFHRTCNYARSFRLLLCCTHMLRTT